MLRLNMIQMSEGMPRFVDALTEFIDYTVVDLSTSIILLNLSAKWNKKGIRNDRFM